eukprot:311122-Hanusia_phi.AAC.1
MLDQAQNCSNLRAKVGNDSCFFTCLSSEISNIFTCVVFSTAISNSTVQISTSQVEIQTNFSIVTLDVPKIIKVALWDNSSDVKSSLSIEFDFVVDEYPFILINSRLADCYRIMPSTIYCFLDFQYQQEEASRQLELCFGLYQLPKWKNCRTYEVSQIRKELRLFPSMGPAYDGFHVTFSIGFPSATWKTDDTKELLCNISYLSHSIPMNIKYNGRHRSSSWTGVIPADIGKGSLTIEILVDRHLRFEREILLYGPSIIHSIRPSSLSSRQPCVVEIGKRQYGCQIWNCSEAKFLLSDKDLEICGNFSVSLVYPTRSNQVRFHVETKLGSSQRNETKANDVVRTAQKFETNKRNMANFPQIYSIKPMEGSFGDNTKLTITGQME